MKIPFSIGHKKFLITPYTTHQEKEILLLSSFEVDDFERIFELLEYESDYKISDLTEEEQKVLLYKFRDISLGDEVNIKFTCDKCKSVNENTLEATNFVQPSKRNDSDVLKLNKQVTDENLQDFVKVNVDELELLEYEELKQRVQDNQIKFNFDKSSRCMKCGTIKTFNMSDKKYIIDIMSDDTLMSIYKTYNNLVFFGHYSKDDIDKMLPFERTILIGLLAKTKEDMSK